MENVFFADVARNDTYVYYVWHDKNFIKKSKLKSLKLSKKNYIGNISTDMAWSDTYVYYVWCNNILGNIYKKSFQAEIPQTQQKKFKIYFIWPNKYLNISFVFSTQMLCQ